MGKLLLNLLICVVAFPFVYTAASIVGFAWFEAFVSNRTFTEYFGFIAGDTLLTWLYYFIFFFAVGIGLPALLRTTRPVAWAACFGLACSLYRLFAGTYHILEPSASLYVQIAGEYVMPVVGCVVGALLGRRLHRKATDTSSGHPFPG